MRANEVGLTLVFGVDEAWLEEEVIDTNAQLVKAGPSSGDDTRVPRRQHYQMNDVVRLVLL